MFFIFRVRAMAGLAAGIFLLMAAIFALAYTTPAAVAQDSKYPYGQGLLWKIEKDGVEAPSYVFGTYHARSRGIVSIPKDVKEVSDALRKATTLGLEIVRLVDPDLETRMVYREGTLLDGRTLDMIVGREMMDKLRAIARKRRVHTAFLHALKPIAAIGLVSGSDEQWALAADNKIVLDNWIEIEAIRQGKKIVPVEDRFEHFFVYPQLPEDEQVRLLKWHVARFASLEERVKRNVDAYRARNIDVFYDVWKEELAQLSPKGAKIWHRALLGYRNEQMVEFGAEYFEAGGFFMAVGALHLPGDDGVLALLAARGFKVSRVW